MAASVKNILIGIFALLALAVIVFMILFLHPSVGDNAKTLKVRFTNIDKVNVGTRVTYAGKPVGEVVSITELPDARTGQLTKNGEVYVYELILEVDSGVHVYNTDEISIRTSGLLGEKNIGIDPHPPKPGENLYLVEDETLYAFTSGNIEDTLKQISELSDKFKTVLDDFHHAMVEIKEEKIVGNISRTVRNALEITNALNQPDKIQRTVDNVVELTERANRSWNTVDASLDSIHSLTKRVHESWATIDQSLQQFHQATGSASDIAKKAQQIIATTAQGKGTIGRLFVDEDLYLRVKSILFKSESIFNDIKQFGLLYQYDKRWQRLQARRLRLLDKMNDPIKFNHYFSQEMDKISTSLSSVSMVLNESECYPYSLLNDPEFTHRFSDLLRNVTEMEDSLKMYNEQVVDQERID